MRKELFECIRELCLLDGVSGREQDVAAVIARKAEAAGAEVRIDNLGSVLAFKKGKERPKKRVLLAAHMDEVGLIVTAITDEGYLKFATVGGVNSKVICGRRVRIGDNGVPGVVGMKHIHATEADERGKAIPIDKLFLDIGAKDRAGAEALVSLGDSAHFVGDYLELGEGVAAKALDDRAGCAMMLSIMREELPCDLWFAFTTQEEIGTRGAKAAAFTCEPELAIILETTASGDVAGVDGADRVTVVGGGAVVSYMDHGTLYDKELYDLAFRLAKEQSIPCQTKTMIAGGNDSGAISVSRGGVRTVAVSVPCRYLHSPADFALKRDIQAVHDLSRALAFELPNLA